MAAMEDEQGSQMNTERNEGKEELKETNPLEALAMVCLLLRLPCSS